MANSGRPKKLNPLGESFFRLCCDPFLSTEMICQQMQISRRTFYRYESELNLPELRAGLLNYSNLPIAKALLARKFPLEHYYANLLREIGLRLGIRVKVICLEHSLAEKALRAGEIDFAIASLSWTKERAKELYFSDSCFPVRPSGNLVSFKKTGKPRIRLKPRLGVVACSPHEDYAKKHLAQYYEILSFATTASLIYGFKCHRLEFLLLNYTEIDVYFKNKTLDEVEINSTRIFYDTYSSILFHRDSADYRFAINQILAELQEENKLDQLWSAAQAFSLGNRDLSFQMNNSQS